MCLADTCWLLPSGAVIFCDCVHQLPNHQVATPTNTTQPTPAPPCPPLASATQAVRRAVSLHPGGGQDAAAGEAGEPGGALGLLCTMGSPGTVMSALLQLVWPLSWTTSALCKLPGPLPCLPWMSLHHQARPVLPTHSSLAHSTSTQHPRLPTHPPTHPPTPQNWLYEEGEEETKSVYVAKLGEVKALGGPVEARAANAAALPAAADALRRTCQVL